VQADPAEQDQAGGEPPPARHDDGHGEGDGRDRRDDPRGEIRALIPTPTATEPPPARAVLLERGLERLAREVGPELVAEDQLGIRRLPEQVLDRRISPLVRMTRSGSCISGA